jgi:hypothetical protein
LGGNFLSFKNKTVLFSTNQTLKSSSTKMVSVNKLLNLLKSGKPKPADESGSFYEFQKVCTELSNESSHKGKTDIIEDYLSSFKGDVYLFLKLILPKADQRKYNLKEKKLIKIFSGIIGTDQEEMLTDLEQGDISETLAKVF